MSGSRWRMSRHPAKGQREPSVSGFFLLPGTMSSGWCRLSILGRKSDMSENPNWFLRAWNGKERLRAAFWYPFCFFIAAGSIGSALHQDRFLLSAGIQLMSVPGYLWWLIIVYRCFNNTAHVVWGYAAVIYVALAVSKRFFDITFAIGLIASV